MQIFKLISPIERRGVKLGLKRIDETGAQKACSNLKNMFACHFHSIINQKQQAHKYYGLSTCLVELKAYF